MIFATFWLPILQPSLRSIVPCINSFFNIVIPPICFFLLFSAFLSCFCPQLLTAAVAIAVRNDNHFISLKTYGSCYSFESCSSFDVMLDAKRFFTSFSARLAIWSTSHVTLVRFSIRSRFQILQGANNKKVISWPFGFLFIRTSNTSENKFDETIQKSMIEFCVIYAKKYCITPSSFQNTDWTTSVWFILILFIYFSACTWGAWDNAPAIVFRSSTKSLWQKLLLNFFPKTQRRDALHFDG